MALAFTERGGVRRSLTGRALRGAASCPSLSVDLCCKNDEITAQIHGKCAVVGGAGLLPRLKSPLWVRNNTQNGDVAPGKQGARWRAVKSRGGA